MDYRQLEHIKKNLENIEKNPELHYKISNTHFKVGAKLHSEVFYYAKPLFQSSSDIKEIAEIIVDKIKKKFQIPINSKILLIGYEMYSELLLSLVSKILTDKGYNDIKHFVGIDNEGVFSFKPNEQNDIFWLKDGLLEKCTAIIVVPIASTGSTAVKIKEAVIKEAEKVVKTKLKEENSDDALKKAIEEQSKLIKFSYKNNRKDYVINVIVAQDDETSQTLPEIIKNNRRQKLLIKLNVKWHLSEECELCFKDNKSEALFGTDKSSLTPALIFDYPKGKTINEEEKDKNSKILFDNVVFNESLKYRRIKRNNEFFLFSINTPTFIKDKYKDNDNEQNIIKWLETLPNDFSIEVEEIKPNDIIILAPCHETNSEFLNLVNEHVFGSYATIIYHQPNVDYIENFKLLNEKTLNEATKFFYVDDNLISGSSFFEIYHLFRDTVDAKKKLTGAILLRDSSTQEMHDRFLRAVNQCRSFVSYNLPPSLSFDNKKPLEHERKRFADLRQFALHDVLIKIFDEKEQELNVDRDKGDKKRRREHIEITPEEQKKYNEEKEKHDKKKKDHYINMFKTTHKVFDYFKRKEINKKDKFDVADLLIDCYGDKNNDTDNKITLLKVLSQYPSILYKPIKEQAFQMHKKWLNEFLDDRKKISSYEIFCELKFLIRRAVYLENLQILDTKFLELISKIFNFIKDEQEGSQKLNSFEKENYKDFPIFLVRSYLELAHKNGWAAVKLLENIGEKEYFKIDDDDAQRFLRMLKIELAAIVNEFYAMLILQYDREWRDVYRDDNENFNEDAGEIKKFFDEKKNKEHYDKLILSNKYDISKQVLKIDNQIENSQSPFINFLWIKQLIHADTHPKSHFPKDVGYQDKIDAIIKKMKEFFPKEPSEKEPIIQAFFVVTDRRQNPYVLSKNELHGFEEEYQTHKRRDRESIEKLEKEITKLKTAKQDTQTKKDELIKIKEQYRYYEIIKFLDGVTDTQSIASETTAEFQFDVKRKEWIDCYIAENDKIKLNFLNKDKTNWLYLIRLSELEDGEFRTLGLLGFYSIDKLFNNPNSLLPKQLLMLLRQDIGKFIKKHHKNDEFSALRQTETIKRFAYLAGHGRQTMRKLALIQDDNCNSIFENVVGTMEKLQYMFAVKSIKNAGNTEDLKERTDKTLFLSSFHKNYPKYNDFTDKIKEWAKIIYENDIVENKVAFGGCCFAGSYFSPNQEIMINNDILEIICFELIINAKKNRWNEENEDSINYTLEFCIENTGKDILIKVTNEGPKMYENTFNKISDGITTIKEDYEVSGLDLIRNVATKYYNGKLSALTHEIIDRENSKYKNTIIVKLQQGNNE